MGMQHGLVRILRAALPLHLGRPESHLTVLFLLMKQCDFMVTGCQLSLAVLQDAKILSPSPTLMSCLYQLGAFPLVCSLSHGGMARCSHVTGSRLSASLSPAAGVMTVVGLSKHGWSRWNCCWLSNRVCLSELVSLELPAGFLQTTDLS